MRCVRNHQTTWLGVAGVAVLAVAGCTPPRPHAHVSAPLKSIASLDCPENQGDLTRRSMAPDGKTCIYAGPEGAQVTLQLVSLDGKDAKAALAPLEASLRAEQPPSPTVAADSTDNDRVDINLPGIHIHANGHGDHEGASAASSGNGHATVSVNGIPGHGGVFVDADDAGAKITTSETGSGTRFSYMLVSDKPGPHGYKLAGYEARGPVGGPLAVVSVLAKSDNEEDLRHDMHALLRHNVGG